MTASRWAISDKIVANGQWEAIRLAARDHLALFCRKAAARDGYYGNKQGIIGLQLRFWRPNKA
jgi:hypothetical protein